MKRIAATGHRPKRLHLTGYDLKPLVALAGQWFDREKPDLVISGMALGWDQAVAMAAIDRKIPVHAYIPFVGQADKWPKASCELYSRILAECAETKLLDLGGYSPVKMQRRNEAMVNDCDLLLALWDGGPGGTANCIQYAEIEGCPVRNLWGRYVEMNDFEV